VATLRQESLLTPIGKIRILHSHFRDVNEATGHTFILFHYSWMNFKRNNLKIQMKIFELKIEGGIGGGGMG